MTPPHLIFFCELDTPALQALFADAAVLETLQALEAGVALGLRDLSQERAAVVRQLNAAGVPVTAWLLLPEAEGYWCNADNAPQAAARYADFRAWTEAEALSWAAVGLDIEPDIGLLRRLLAGDGRALGAWLRAAFAPGRLQRARVAYAALVAQMRADGFTVESYHFPFVVDERRADATLLQRLLGLVEVATDREVLMLYSSFLPEQGPGLLWSYAPDAEALAVGITGGGVDLPNALAPLDWATFARDLRLAWMWQHTIYIFSLEGCVQQGFLSRLVDFDWAEVPPSPLKAGRRVDRVRALARALLWLSRYPGTLLAALVGGWALWRICRARRRE